MRIASPVPTMMADSPSSGTQMGPRQTCVGPLTEIV